MKRFTLLAMAGVLALGALAGSQHPAFAGRSADPEDLYPELKKKIVPILTFGSNLNIGAAQVQGEEKDVDRCKAVAQLETDYKDAARIKILVPVQSEDVIKHIDRVPGVSVSAIADIALKK